MRAAHTQQKMTQAPHPLPPNPQTPSRDHRLNCSNSYKYHPTSKLMQILHFN